MSSMLQTTKDNLQGIKSDLSMVPSLLGFKKNLSSFRDQKFTTTDLWYRVFVKNPQKICFYFEDTEVTYQQVEDRSNQISNWLIGKGVKPGDTVALLMENRPEFVIAWLGMTKAGIKVALINTSIKQKGLLHCVKISECKMLVFGAELSENVLSIKSDLENLGIMLYSDGDSFAPNLTPEVSRVASHKVTNECRAGHGLLDVFGYIYTSGTTGLPKAAIILHQKMSSFGMLMTHAFHTGEDDIVYTCLPLFHSAGGGLGIGIMLYTGCSVVIAKKFSATNFFADCAKYNVTVVQYIGELCRYLLLAPERKEDKQHKVRIAIGNGLRPEIWAEFQQRFNIPEVGEFYGATEGNLALWNHCLTPEDAGFCGKFGPLLRKLLGVQLVKFDVVNEEPVRGEDGFCVPCEPGEAGELLFIIKPEDPGTAFAGYSDKKATEKKILRDAFVSGDQYFRTGDLLSRDVRGYYKFVDRIGDTFRWKGENCSTTEVTEVMSTFPGIEEVNVYGVQIPNNMDGRAPTAGITPVDGNMSNLNLEDLPAYLSEHLPSYAVPLFLRVLPQMAVTATMKHQKVKLRTEGVDVSKVSDPILWLNPKTKQYEPFGQEQLDMLSEQKAKL